MFIYLQPVTHALDQEHLIINGKLGKRMLINGANKCYSTALQSCQEAFLITVCSSVVNIPGGGVDDLSFFDYLSPLCFLLIEFQCTFSISYKILPDYVYYYCISIRM